MRQILFAIAAAFISSCSTMSPQDQMQADVDQAAAIIERFEAIPEKGIPPAVIKNARGVAIITVTKAGSVGSARGGSYSIATAQRELSTVFLGVVVARSGKGWSGPSAIGTGGLGVGFQAGAEVTEFVIILNPPAAVEAFSKQSNVTLGGNLSIAAGPIGRSAEASVALQSAMYSYSRTQGLFAGVSLEGTAIGVRDDVNAGYYGRSVTANDILSGKVPPPARAERLLSVLSKY